MKTTIKEMVSNALKANNESTDDLVCFWQEREGSHYWFSEESEKCPIKSGGFDDLPDREYDAGFGGTEGPPFIGYTKKHVYISVQYDGAEDIEAIPRHPKYVKYIPWPGG